VIPYTGSQIWPSNVSGSCKYISYWWNCPACSEVCRHSVRELSLPEVATLPSHYFNPRVAVDTNVKRNESPEVRASNDRPWNVPSISFVITMVDGLWMLLYSVSQVVNTCCDGGLVSFRPVRSLLCVLRCVMRRSLIIC
jgi:hypothetical protein